MMKHYLSSGASAYLYWNISLMRGGVSRWGWAQNSPVTVNALVCYPLRTRQQVADQIVVPINVELH